jgi:hypothetical protein
MTRPLAVRAEIIKLARLLRVDPEELDYLDQVPEQAVRELREQVTDALFAANSGALGRLAAASKLLPVRVVATIGQRAFGPILAGRITGLLDPDRAVEMAATMPVDFLADVAVELDPRRASAVISRIPPKQIAAVTRELLRRDEHVTMGRFVGHLGDAAIRASVGEMTDADLLQVAFVLESKDALDDLISLLPVRRRDALVDVASANELWPEALDLLSHLSDERCRELAESAARRDDAVLDSLIRAAQDESMWNAALRVTRCMSQESRARFARLPSISGEGVLESIVVAAAEYELWPALLPLVAELPAESQERVARAAARLDPAQRERIAEQARAAGMDEQLALLDAALARD